MHRPAYEARVARIWWPVTLAVGEDLDGEDDGGEEEDGAEDVGEDTALGEGFSLKAAFWNICTAASTAPSIAAATGSSHFNRRLIKATIATMTKTSPTQNNTPILL